MAKTDKSDIGVRSMEEDDLAQVLSIEKQCFSVPWHKFSFDSALELGSSCYLVAVSGERIVGYLGFSYVMDEGELCKIAVHPALQRQGIGKILLEQGISTVKGLGVTHIFLEVRMSNEKAIGLYRHFGFQELGVRRNYYREPLEDALVMCWKV